MNEPTETYSASEHSWFDRTFGRAWVGFIGMVITILAFATTIYVYFDSIKVNKLAYTIRHHSIHLTKPDIRHLPLEIFYKSILVKTNLTVTQIYVWNAGDVAIESLDILKPVRIQTINGAEIYDAIVSYKSRDIIIANLDKDFRKEGVLELKWNILERNDGIIIEVYFAEDESEEVLVDGVIKGQGKLEYIDPRDVFSPHFVKPIYQIMFLLFCAYIMIDFLYYIYPRKEEIEIPSIYEYLVLIAFVILLLMTFDTPTNSLPF